mmetsp:Transcript_11773/g.15362  ORF Transcript_11773/g.15362 Transcript_11773/m.15362 type:complete len:285 (-) Transcript_11773:229-1083(-)
MSLPHHQASNKQKQPLYKDSSSYAHSEEPKFFPDFLRKLVDILKSDSTSNIIEWKRNKIYIHDPTALCKEILPEYFRHSNIASFARQLNYFGFRKTEGKGRDKPCVYSCDELAGKGIDGIFDLKRKAPKPKSKDAMRMKSGEPSSSQRLQDYSVGFINRISSEGNPLLLDQKRQHEEDLETLAYFLQGSEMESAPIPMMKGAPGRTKIRQPPVFSFENSDSTLDSSREDDDKIASPLISSGFVSQRTNPFKPDGMTIRKSKEISMKEDGEPFLDQEDLHMLMNL